MRTILCGLAGGILFAVLVLVLGVATTLLLAIVLSLVAIAVGLADYLRTHG